MVSNFKNNRKASRVGKTGFPCFELMSELMPSAARGMHAYRPSNSEYGSGNGEARGTERGPRFNMPGAQEICATRMDTNVDSDPQAQSDAEESIGHCSPPSAYGPPSSVIGAPSSVIGAFPPSVAHPFTFSIPSSAIPSTTLAPGTHSSPGIPPQLAPSGNVGNLPFTGGMPKFSDPENHTENLQKWLSVPMIYLDGKTV
ncbi:hypothetical protein K439DRAFT_1620541 [Ramaria rubella]|nr:hypothetical protein K439DRAFT_1620541 [Ramaria rubella]